MQNELRPVRPATSAALLLLGLAAPAAAQVRHSGEPAGPRLAFADHVPTVTVPRPDVDTLLDQDLEREEAGVGPFRYGVVIPTSVDFGRTAAWDVSEDGVQLVGRLRIEAPGAFSQGLEFAAFNLPEEGRMFVYDEREERTVFGAYTHAERIPVGRGQFVIEPFPGDSLVLEYWQPTGLTVAPEIELSGVIYDYHNFPEMERGWNETQSGGGSPDGGCTVSVNCPEGDPYELQKRATVRTLAGGGLCSGALINNTADDGTQYLYTANHCGQNNNVNVRFNYQTANCNGGGAPTNQSVSGAVLLATDQDTDGRLMRITNSIPASYSPYFSGWSRASANLTFGMSMHHPGGSPKNISIDSNGGGKGTSGFIGIGTVKVWFMNFQIGGTAGGSSGGPLFGENLLIRGTLTGGPESNCANSQYGRFRPFWNDTNISTFLDPLGTGTETHGGFDPNAVTPVLNSIAPTAVTAFQPGAVSIFGSGFSGVHSVHVGATTLTTGQFSIVSPTEISFNPPLPATLGTVNVSVENGVAVTATATLDYTEASPPKLTAPIVVSSGLNVDWAFGGGPSDAYLLLANVGNPTTFPFGSFDLLLAFDIIDLGVLDAGNGTGSFSVPMPAGFPILSNLYSQVVTVDGSSNIDGSSVTATIIL